MTEVYAVRTAPNREDQVAGFLTSHVEKKKFQVYSIIVAHGMRGYIFVEAENRQAVEEAVSGVPYARGVLKTPITYEEVAPLIEQVKQEVNIQKNDVVEIISGPFKREKAKVTRIDLQKGELVVELLETAVPIPITLKLDVVKVIRREKEEE